MQTIVKVPNEAVREVRCGTFLDGRQPTGKFPGIPDGSKRRGLPELLLTG